MTSNIVQSKLKVTAYHATRVQKGIAINFMIEISHQEADTFLAQSHAVLNDMLQR